MSAKSIRPSKTPAFGSSSRRRASAEGSSRVPRPSSNPLDVISQNVSPAARTKMAEKREMRDLNGRLEYFMRRMRDKSSESERLKKLLAESEVSFRQKMKETDAQQQKVLDQVRADNESLNLQLTATNDEIESYRRVRSQLEERNASLEQTVTRKVTELEMKEKEIGPLRAQLSSMAEEMVSLKSSTQHDFKQVSKLRRANEELVARLKHVSEELVQLRARHKVEVETYTRTVTNRNQELESLKQRCSKMNAEKQHLETKVRKEFDVKMASFVEKREQQYEQEKTEWIRIFKEEFQSKVRRYKEANMELTQSLKKGQEENDSMKQRLAALRKTKAELDLACRNHEEDIEKLRADLDDLRDAKDDELKKKTQDLFDIQRQLNETKEALDEVTNGKLQLDSEIAFYRELLSQAETECGFTDSPFLRSVKKRRLNTAAGINTPGYVRGRQQARRDLDDITSVFSSASAPRRRAFGGGVDSTEEDMSTNGLQLTGECPDTIEAPARRSRKRKFPDPDVEVEGSSFDETEDGKFSEEFDTMIPGEAYPLQFSTMDLSEGTLELQNVSDQLICLGGYYLTNKDKRRVLKLPRDRSLEANERVRIVVGTAQHCAAEDIEWPEDVWSGIKEDVCRLYNCDNEEVARIEITPEMLSDNVLTHKGCAVM